MSAITVVKLDPQGREKIRYPGKLLKRSEDEIYLEARFISRREEVGGIVFREGDRFLESYHRARWYAIAEIRDREDDSLKGWYCDSCYPALIEARKVTYHDLALDLLVYPDGRQVLLDEEEFEALSLSEETRSKALAGMAELRARFNNGEFDLQGLGS